MNQQDDQERENIAVAAVKLREALEAMGFEMVFVCASVTRNDVISSYSSLGGNLDMKEIGARLMLISGELSDHAKLQDGW